MEKVKKVFKVIGIIFLVIIILLLLFLAGAFIYHRINISRNKKILKENGYYDLVSVGDHSLNLVRYGGSDDKHRIVALGGNGPGFPVEFRKLANELLDQSAVYYLARAGYDGSDDVDKDMTVEFVVEDYRKALQNAGVKAPYILMPHSYAGILASYWVSKYPDEIEAMIDLDGIVAQPFTDEQLKEADEEIQKAGLSTVRTLVKMGIVDVALHVMFPKEPSYSKDEQKASDAMTLMTLGNEAYISDLKCVVANTNDTWNAIKPNNVPKLYINATNGYHTVEELKADDVLDDFRINELTEDFEGSDEERREKAYELEFEEMEKYIKEKMQPYAEKLGGCEIVDLPGGHFIHMDKPYECARIIKEFISGLDK